MKALTLPFTARFITLTLSILLALSGWAQLAYSGRHGWLFLAIPFSLLSLLGLRDLFNVHHAILRNYPIIAHMRFILESIRPELRQYFFEDDTVGAPFSRTQRAVVYQRAKMVLDKRPFGTQIDVYEEGFEWLHHSIVAQHASDECKMRVRIGGTNCTHPYDSSLLNISAMSYGALSPNAIRALNAGARLGNFAHDTGEGGVSPYHLENGGDLIWEIGSGYFGARNEEGQFCPDRFAQTARLANVKMIEIKLSQGAKPGHGGVLPAAKVSAEIAAIRGVRLGEDCVSPASHSMFSTPIELLRFIAQLRALSGGKPTGFKLCVGHPWEFLAICKAMMETGILPDFIVVDGKEGGTGAAPLEFMDHLGMPLREGLSFVHNALIGINVREQIRIGASGKIATAFDMARTLALGADWCNAARAFMFSLGCIQSLSCHTDRCPTGVTTQDPTRGRALVVTDKKLRVFQYHTATLHALAELTAAAGLKSACEFGREHFSRRITQNEIQGFATLYPALKPGELLSGSDDARFAAAWELADANSFRPRVV